MDKLVYSVFRSSEEPVLTVKDYQDEYIQLKAVVTTMEKNIKSLLKLHVGQQKTINSDSSFATERKLFIHFFTDTDKLHNIIGQITKRIDTISATLSQ